MNAESLLSHLTNRTAETLLILNLFHLLLAGLAVLVLLHLRINRGVTGRPDRLVTLGAAALVTHFTLLTLRFGVAFFLHEQLQLAGLERLSHALLVAAVLLIAGGYLDAAGNKILRFLPPGLITLAALLVVDLLTGRPVWHTSPRPHSWEMLSADMLAIAVLLLAMRSVLGGECDWEGRRFRLLTLGSMTAVFLMHVLPSIPASRGILLWNLQEHLMSLALFAFTWGVGERSQHLLDRVFVRLNLTFLILASLIMMTSASMEKYQYFRLAEERSTGLAEFVRGHYIYYSERGESLEQIFDHPEVLRRVVAEFSSLPELREVNVYAAGQRAQFRYMPNFEVKETIGADDALTVPQPESEFRNSFQMIRLPIHQDNARERIEFIGTLDFVNAYIGRYIVFIYCAFTLTLGMGTVIIGMIVVDADRQLRRRYTELQEAQQRLAQSAKLASIGELAGGMAHEINNPITSILALSSHMADSEAAATSLSPRNRKNLALIARQAERVASLVSGLLTFSRQAQLHIANVDVAQVLDSAIELVGFRLDRSSIQVRRELETALPPVQADASRLTEVFVNLLTNAIDVTPSGGIITVRALRPNDETLRVEVQDAGSGIAAQDLPRIFDPFFTTKAPGRGTGLGLSISHGIIKNHSGEIWAQSEPDQGTTIVVSLPVGAMHYEPACTGN